MIAIGELSLTKNENPKSQQLENAHTDSSIFEYFLIKALLRFAVCQQRKN
jgi:hypothetical protein